MGYNTDGIGFLQPLHALNVSWSDTAVCIIGAGGAARAITMALLQQGCPRLTVVNRTPERGERLVEALLGQFPRRDIRFVPLPQAAQTARASTLVVNATAVGLHDDGTPLFTGHQLSRQTDRLRYCLPSVVHDSPRTAQHCGATVVPGIDMLIGQGAKAFHLWTGSTFPVEPVRQLLHPLIEPPSRAGISLSLAELARLSSPSIDANILMATHQYYARVFLKFFLLFSDDVERIMRPGKVRLLPMAHSTTVMQ